MTPNRLAQMKTWRQNNAKTLVGYRRLYYLSHKEETHKRTSKWRAQNPEYVTWLSMLWRCKNPQGPDFEKYGSRGITVRYKNFYEFLADVGCRPSGAYSIDRIDNNGHYEAGNCRWATRAQQRGNRRDSAKVSNV